MTGEPLPSLEIEGPLDIDPAFLVVGQKIHTIRAFNDSVFAVKAAVRVYSVKAQARVYRIVGDKRIYGVRG